MIEVSDPWSDPTIAERILRDYRVWAVVGCSSNPKRASHGVARYLIRAGYEVVPINPNEREVHGLTAYPDVRSVPDELRTSRRRSRSARRRSGCSSTSGTSMPPSARLTQDCSSS
jgi:hypothetical protein